MPGIYIDPASGSQITSTLGNILGGMATNMDPKTQAEAQELRTRTIGEDLANQKLKAIIAGATGIPGVLSAGNADPTAGQGGVAGTLAGAAVPPNTGPAPGTFGGGAVNANFDPYARVLSGSYLNDPSMGNFSTGINLGKDLTTGPGTDFTTQNEIVRAKGVPYDVSTGVEHHIPGGAGPETVVTSGQDPATNAATVAQRNADIADANQKSSLGAGAAANLGELSRLNQIYDTLVNTPDTSDLAGVIGDEGLKFLANATHVDVTRLSSRIGAMQAIQSRMRAMLGSTVASIQGDTPIRGILSSALQTLPDPTTMSPEQYRGAVGQLTRALQSQADEAGPADVFRNSGFTKQDADAFHTAIQAVQAKHAKDFATQPEPGTGSAPSPKAAPAAAPPSMRAATPGEIAEARAGAQKVPQGFTGPQWRDRIIKHARDQGIDLGNF